MKKITIRLTFVVLLILLFSCKEHYTPKPLGYFRIDLPTKNYMRYTSTCPYSFEYPDYASITPDSSPRSEACFLNVTFKNFNGRLHLSYKEVNNNLAQFTEDAHMFVYKHTIKADAIDETIIHNDSTHVYGIIYDLKGNVASNIQFFLTDSNRHFLRGALYFGTTPNKDSLAPVIEFIRKDIVRIGESLRWGGIKF